MIERGAAILYGGNLADCYHPELFRRLARRFIEAMREPTPEIEDAARGLFLFYCNPKDSNWTLGQHNDAGGYKLSLTDEERALIHAPKHVVGRIAWRTMMDKVLK